MDSTQEGDQDTRSRQDIQKSKAFSVLMILFEAAVAFAHGFAMRPTLDKINYQSVLHIIGLLLLVVLGFGLVFSYTKRLMWSGLGFNLLISAISIQLYPLMTTAFQKSSLYNEPNGNIDFRNPYFMSPASGATFSDNTMVDAIKCALACCCAFSSLLGRVGCLEAWLVAVFGTVGYSICSRIATHFAVDTFGTLTIFTYGGFMGLVAGTFLATKDKKNTISQFVYTADQASSTFALIGTGIVFSFMPLLTYSSVHAKVLSGGISKFTSFIGVYQAEAAGTVGAIAISLLYNRRLGYRDILHGPIAGAIAGGTSAVFTAEGPWNILAGFLGACIQIIIQNGIEKNWIRNGGKIINTVSFSLFGVMGLLGSVWATINMLILQSLKGRVSNSVLQVQNPGFMVAVGLVTALIGVIAGSLLGGILLIIPANSHSAFNDNFYWTEEDALTQSENPKIKNRILEGAQQ